MFTCSCTSVSWPTEQEIFLVPTFPATWEFSFSLQSCRESPLIWAQQFSLPTASYTHFLLHLAVTFHHLWKGKMWCMLTKVAEVKHRWSPVQINMNCYFLWMKKWIPCQYCWEAHVFASLEKQGLRQHMSKPTQHIALVAIFIPLKTKDGHGLSSGPQPAQGQLSSGQEGLVNYSFTRKWDVWIKNSGLVALLHYEGGPCLWAVPTRTVRHLPEMVQRSSWSWHHSQLASWAQPPSSRGQGCSSLPVGLRARGQSQACLITSMSSWVLHPCNSKRNLGFPLHCGVSLWPQDIITMSALVIQFKVLEIAECYVARSVFIAQIECVCWIHRGVPGGHGKCLKSSVFWDSRRWREKYVIPS